MRSPEDRRAAVADVTDAFWQVPASDYLPKGPAPERSIVDESRRRLELIWDSTVQTLHDDADDDAKHQDETKTRLATFARRVETRRRDLAAAEPPKAAELDQQVAVVGQTQSVFRGLLHIILGRHHRLARLQRVLPHRS